MKVLALVMVKDVTDNRVHSENIAEFSETHEVCKTYQGNFWGRTTITKGNEYEVIRELNTAFKIKADDGNCYSFAKEYFKVLDNTETAGW